MKETKKGSPNGITVNVYVKDQEYDLPESLTKTFLKMGACKMVVAKENKDAGPAPQNKDVEPEKVEKKKKDKKDKEGNDK
jgi:hypothetical protein